MGKDLEFTQRVSMQKSCGRATDVEALTPNGGEPQTGAPRSGARRDLEIPSAAELRSAMRERGLSDEGDASAVASAEQRAADIKEHLRARGLGTTDTSKGRSYSSLKVKKTFAGTCRPCVGLVRLVSLYAYFRDRPEFSFAGLAPAFKISGDDAVQEFAVWACQFVDENEIEDLVPDATPASLETAPQSASSGEEEASEAEDDDDAQEKSSLAKSHVPSRYLAAVVQCDLHQFCLGMAVHTPALGDGTEDAHRLLCLQQLMLNQTVDHVRKTFCDYYGYVNCYFVWLYTQEGVADRWGAGEDLLIRHETLLRFLCEYSTNKVRATGTLPWIGDVLSGDAEPCAFESSPSTRSVGAGTLKKIATAVSRFEGLQHAVIGKPVAEPVATHVSIRAFLKRAKVAGPNLSRKRLLDRQRRVNLAGFDLDKKIKESGVYLAAGTAADIRDRAVMCCATFSVSRYTEASRWDLADTFAFTYPQETVAQLAQPFRCVYVIQGQSKTRCDDEAEDWNCLTRNKRVEQCPIGALSLWLFWRFHVLKEQFPRIEAEKSAWYSVKVFPHAHDPTAVVCPTANRQRKKRALEATGTRGRAVLHDDRHFGAWWARLHEVPSTELDLLGFWRMDTRTQVYTKVHVPSTIVRMSGFNDVAEYFLPRAVLSPYDTGDAEIQAFADAIFSQVDDEDLKRAVEQKCRGDAAESDYAARNVLGVFRLLRTVFLQDLSYYRSEWPSLAMWKSDVFVNHAVGARKWLELQCDVVADLENLTDRLGGPPRMLTAESRRSGAIVAAAGPAPHGFVKRPIEGSTQLAILLKDTASSHTDAALPPPASDDATQSHDVATLSASLRGVWSVLESQTKTLSMLRCEMKEARRERKNAMERPITTGRVITQEPPHIIDLSTGEEDDFGNTFQHDPRQNLTLPTVERSHLVTKLPPLSSYTLHSLVHEWLVSFHIAGVETETCMGRLEREREEAGLSAKPWRAPKLRGEVFKRRAIAEEVQRVASERFGGHSPAQIASAVQHLESKWRDEMGAKYSLYGVFARLKGYSDKRRQ